MPTAFAEMLTWARQDHPDATLVIKTHPETRPATATGHFDPEPAAGRVTRMPDPVSPWRLFETRGAVYTVSQPAGVRGDPRRPPPVTFGQPFYAGWGLTEDRRPPARAPRPAR
jgi:capsular polysaccharide export protein